MKRKFYLIIEAIKDGRIRINISIPKMVLAFITAEYESGFSIPIQIKAYKKALFMQKNNQKISKMFDFLSSS